MRKLVAALLVIAATVRAQSIETHRIGVLVDRDGRGFTRAPGSIAAIASGQFALSETNVAPLIVDSAGALVRRFVRGDGPGEFQVPGTQFMMAGDTLYATNGSGVNIYDRTGKFVRTVPTIGIYTMQAIPARGGLLVSSQKFESPTKAVGLHLLDAGGRVVRSFLSDSNIDRRSWPPPPAYRIAPGSNGTVWAAAIHQHRIEKWTLDGEKKLVISRRPAWFVIAPTFGNTANVRSIHEAGGLLWVMSSVPVPDAREIERKAIADATKGKTRSEVDVRQIPYERLETSYVEVYDASTGAFMAELALGKFGVGILDDHRFVVHSFSPDETSQLEIWEMKLRR